MGQDITRDGGHADGLGGEGGQLDERLGDDGDGGQAGLGEDGSVTHGAGCTAASMPPGSEDDVALFGDGVD